MLFDLSLAQIAALTIALVGAAYVRGYSGFGFSAIIIASASLITNPLPLVPVVFACEILMTAFQARCIRPHIDWRRVGALLLGAAIVLPFSVTALLALGEDTARLVISAIVLIMSLILLSGWTLTRTIGAAGHAGVGIASGLCNAAGIGGLPVAAFMTAQPMAAATFRATMIVYLTGLDLITLPWLWHGGMITTDTALGVVYAFPFLGLGLWLGSQKFGKASPQGFRKFTIAILLILSALGLIRAIL